MIALCFHCSPARYLACKALAPIWKNVYTSRIAPARLRQIPLTDSIPTGWARVGITQCGLCSSDLHIASLDLSPKVAPAAVFNDVSATTILGHELVGVVETVSGSTSLAVGQRVISRSGSFRNCFNAGYAENPCAACATGEYNLCARQGELTTAIEPIRHGGFASHYLEHSRNLLAVPDGLSDDQAALVEPLACSLRAVLRSGAMPGARVLVVGGGIQGLGAVHWLHSLHPDAAITCAARHGYQADLARALGATNILHANVSFDEIAQLLGTQVTRGPVGGNELLVGGFDVVIDSIGTPSSIERSLRLVRPHGRLVILGTTLRPGRFDFTPLWFREVETTGVYAHGREVFDGQIIRTLELTMQLLNDHPLPAQLITHRLPLSRITDAFHIAQDKRTHQSVRVMITP